MVVYGLTDASRVWYLRIIDELSKLGVSISSYDKALFYWHFNGKLGLLLIHVDDFLWSGSIEFVETITSRIKEIFRIPRECEQCFKYIGVNIIQADDIFEIDQLSYIKSIKRINIDMERLKDMHSESGNGKKIVEGIAWPTQLDNKYDST